MILLAGVRTLVSERTSAGAQQRLTSLPEMDQRATRIRHLHLPYTFQPFLTEEAWLKRAGESAAADTSQRRAVAAGGEESTQGADLREGLQGGLFHREGLL